MLLGDRVVKAGGVQHLGSAAGNSCQKFQNQSVIPTGSRARKYSQVSGSALQIQLSTREPEIFPGAPSEIVINAVPEGDSADVPPAMGRACFQGKKKYRKRTKLKIRVMFVKGKSQLHSELKNYSPSFVRWSNEGGERFGCCCLNPRVIYVQCSEENTSGKDVNQSRARREKLSVLQNEIAEWELQMF